MRGEYSAESLCRQTKRRRGEGRRGYRRARGYSRDEGATDDGRLITPTDSHRLATYPAVVCPPSPPPPLQGARLHPKPKPVAATVTRSARASSLPAATRFSMSGSLNSCCAVPPDPLSFSGAFACLVPVHHDNFRSLSRPSIRSIRCCRRPLSSFAAPFRSGTHAASEPD